MNDVTVFSSFAASLSTISFTPQAWQIIKLKNNTGISTGMPKTEMVSNKLDPAVRQEPTGRTS
jgi:uncharacterized protein with PQ loop repeat